MSRTPITTDNPIARATFVIFNANGSSDNVGIVRYECDFGDEATGIGVIVTHTYTEPETYTGTLTVRAAAHNSGTDTIINDCQSRPLFSYVDCKHHSSRGDHSSGRAFYLEAQRSR